MLTAIWNYLRGYVMIVITGFSAERLINMSAFRGIGLWDIRRENKTTAKVSVKDFRAFLPLARKTGCNVRVTGKVGLPFWLWRYRKRKVLLFGAVFFAAALYILSSLIWLVEVEVVGKNANAVDAGAVVEFLRGNGVKAGVWKNAVDERAVENAIQLRFNRVAWAAVDVKGTRVAVTLTETLPDAPITDMSAISDVTAAADGLITKIVTVSGTVKAAVGDVVKEGDVLISGELIIGSEDEGQTRKYVRAVGEVWARVRYEATVDMPLMRFEREYTGNIKKERNFIVFDRSFTPFVPKVDYADFEVIRNKSTLRFGRDYPLPLSYATTEYREYVMTAVTTTEEQAAYSGRETALELVWAELDSDADILSREAVYERIDDFVRATVTVEVERRIDKEKIMNGE